MRINPENPSVETMLALHDQRITALEKTLGRLVWLGATTLLAAIGGLLSTLLKHSS